MLSFLATVDGNCGTEVTGVLQEAAGEMGQGDTQRSTPPPPATERPRMVAHHRGRPGSHDQRECLPCLLDPVRRGPEGVSGVTDGPDHRGDHHLGRAVPGPGSQLRHRHILQGLCLQFLVTR